jgi:sialate O-acetylesterase
MQVHNWAAGQTLFAFNGWGEAPENADLGIGPSPGEYPDWTLAQNASSYVSKVLQVYVLPGTVSAPTPLAPRNVPEATGYTLVYSLSLPDASNYNLDGVPYDLDDHATVGKFSRVAYYLEIQPSGAPTQYLWVSMDAFTADAGKIGVPAIQTGAFFQQPLTNMNVRSSVAGVVTGDGLSGGNIEFWWGDYSKGNAAGVPGASSTLYDFGDSASPRDPAGYGSMQIHNWVAGQTLFAFNGWGEPSEAADLGIGNNPGEYPDWTLAQNAAQYTTKVLQVYVLP